MLLAEQQELFCAVFKALDSGTFPLNAVLAFVIIKLDTNVKRVESNMKNTETKFEAIARSLHTDIKKIETKLEANAKSLENNIKKIETKIDQLIDSVSVHLNNHDNKMENFENASNGR